MPPPRQTDAAAPARTPPATPTAMRWGLVGSLHRVEPLTLLPGQTGVVRLLPNTVRYTRPPLDVAWAAVKAEPGRFEMAWPGNPATARTLADVGAAARKLHAAGRTVPAGHPVCRELDAAVFALVTAAGQLARQGWGVGLLTPAGVMLRDGPNCAEAVPVDLGFTWVGEFGDPPWDHSPGKPDWLSADPADNPVSLVWDRPPTEQQFAAPADGPHPKPDEASAVRTLARVIAWTLTGSPARDLPDDPAPVWGVLRAAVAGDVATFDELVDRLRAAPPSTHFAEPEVLLSPSREVRAPSKKRLAVLGLLVLTALSLGLYLLLTGGNDTPTLASGTTPTDPADSGEPTASPGFAEQLATFRQLPADNLADRLNQFPDLVRAAGADPAAGKVVNELRAALLTEWAERCEAALGESADAPRRAAAGHRLRELTDAFQAVHDRAAPADPAVRDKERQWLDHFDRQAAALGWPR